MAIIKCKMCGGDLEVTSGTTVAECEFCGTKQTLPKVNEEVVQNLFNRANALRLKCEFDKAEQIYERILQEDDTEAEAHWGIVLCKYGIEYVEDPKTFQRIPTCHRTSYDAVTTDADYLAAVEHADAAQKAIYETEAKVIDSIQKNILSIVKDEKPFDVFLCYKESDENGKRTVDSSIANDIYYQLTQEGLKVFYAAITLEDKLGQEYEPYIFAALNSAKVMLVIGTKPQYFTAVWVKNEWSRFFKLMKTDRSKLLIPCYRDMDAYDLPEEFAHLQAQDMSKIGFINDVVRGVRKLMPQQKENNVAQERPASPQQYTVSNYIKRGNISLVDGDWEDAKGFFENALNLEAECAEAYFGLAMCEEKVSTLEQLVNRHKWESKYYRRGKQFANVALLEQVDILEKKVEKQPPTQTKEAHQPYTAKRQSSENDEQKRLRAIREKLAPAQNIIAAGVLETIGICSDGTVLTTAGISNWHHRAAVSIENSHVVCLYNDGTVMNSCIINVSDWKDIIAVAAGRKHTVGLHSDGTVVAAGNNTSGQCNVSDWQDIVAITAGKNHTVGLRSNGTVVAAGNNAAGQCNISDWQDIVAIAAGGDHTVGLRSDGMVVAVGSNIFGQCNVSDWQDIVAIAVSVCHTVGVRSDGSVVAVGSSAHGKCKISGWREVVAVAAGEFNTVGVRSDGSVVAVGNNYNGRCKVSGWKLFDNLENLEQERQQKAQKQEERRAKGLCQYCGGTFKMGLLTSKCAICRRPKIY